MQAVAQQNCFADHEADGAGSLQVLVVSLSGDILVRTTVAASELIGILKDRIEEAGGPIQEHQQLFLNGSMLQRTETFEELGVVNGNVVTVTVVSSVNESFRWGKCSGGQISDAPQMYHRGNLANFTNGVIAASPLPRDASWKVNFSLSGTHNSVGVAFENAPLKVYGYTFLHGSVGDGAWALVFGRNSLFATHHKDELLEFSDVPQALPSDVSIRLRLATGTKLFAVLPGERHERLLFGDLPPNSRLFAVASTCFSRCAISIEEDFGDSSTEVPTSSMHN